MAKKTMMDKKYTVVVMRDGKKVGEIDLSSDGKKCDTESFDHGTDRDRSLTDSLTIASAEWMRKLPPFSL